MGRPVGIDLFAGAGGLSLGFEQAGFDVVGAVEIDPVHCAVHHFNFPTSTPICADVTKLSGDEIRERAGIADADIDVVFGGAPCQGFSMIGKRALDDPRNHLVFHFVRLIFELKPKFFVFENVKGLTLGLQKQFLLEIIEELGKKGYQLVQPYQVLNAADYGVPQDRRRLFLIGAREGCPLPNYPGESDLKVTVSEAIDDLPNADDFDLLSQSDATIAHWETSASYARVLRGIDSDPADFSYPRAHDLNLLTSSLRTEHTALSKQRFQQTRHGETEPVSRFHKLDPKSVCNTLRAGTDSARGAFTSPRPIHPSHLRVITVREAARLHSYPDWFRFHQTKWHGFREIGNSVPPLLSRAVASELIKALGNRPSKPKRLLRLGDGRLLTLDMTEAAKYFCVENPIAQRARKEHAPKLRTRENSALYRSTARKARRVA